MNETNPSRTSCPRLQSSEKGTPMRILILSCALWGLPAICFATDRPATPATVVRVLTEAEAGDRVLLSAGTYYARKLLINKPLTLQGAGKGMTIIKRGFRAWQGAEPTGIRIENVSGVTISDLTIRNVTTAGSESYFGILVSVSSACSDITIKNVEVASISWSGEWIGGETGNAIGVKVWSGSALNELRNLTITDCHVHDCRLGSGEAISLGGKVAGFIVSRNVVERIDNIGIDAAGGYAWFNGVPAGGSIRFNTVRNVNTATNPAYAGSKAAAGIYVDGGRRITVADNVINACNFGISISSENRRTNARFNRILRNRISHPTEFAFNVGGDTGTTATGFAFDNFFTGNTVIGSPSEAMVLFGRTRPYFSGSKSNDWTSNTFKWINKPASSPWWTPPAGDIDLGDIESDKTNKRIAP